MPWSARKDNATNRHGKKRQGEEYQSHIFQKNTKAVKLKHTHTHKHTDAEPKCTYTRMRQEHRSIKDVDRT